MWKIVRNIFGQSKVFTLKKVLQICLLVTAQKVMESRVLHPVWRDHKVLTLWSQKLQRGPETIVWVQRNTFFKFTLVQILSPPVNWWQLSNLFCFLKAFWGLLNPNQESLYFRMGGEKSSRTKRKSLPVNAFYLKKMGWGELKGTQIHWSKTCTKFELFSSMMVTEEKQ